MGTVCKQCVAGQKRVLITVGTVTNNKQTISNF
jgi:hypothetical protein